MPRTINTSKVALILSGGAFNGAFQFGALKYLHDNWNAIFQAGRPLMEFDFVSGVSVGALNGAMVASHQFDELERLWETVARKGAKEIFLSDIIDTESDKDSLQFRKLGFKFIWQALFQRKKLMSRKALADNSPLQEKLKRIIHRNQVGMNFRCGIASISGYGDYTALGPNDFATDEDFRNAVLASTAMPIVWEPVPKITLANGTEISNAMDGGIRTVAPLGDAVRFIVEENPPQDYTIIIINCSNNRVDPEPPERGYTSNIFQIALRSAVMISQNEIINDDLKWFLKINDMVRQAQAGPNPISLYDYDWITRSRATRPFKAFDYVLIEPDLGVIGDELVANERMIRKRIEHGVEKAGQAF